MTYSRKNTTNYKRLISFIKLDISLFYYIYMKSLYESILGSMNSGKKHYEEYIKSQPIYHYEDVTFRDFLSCVDKDTFTKCLKQPFKDAKNTLSALGQCEFYFKDGALSITIAYMNVGLRGGKWWREAFIMNDEKHPGKENYRAYEYSEEFCKSAENGCCGFSSGWNERINNVAPEYLQYLKDHYEKLLKR